MAGILVVAHLYILNACIERIVSVGAALTVLGLAGFQLVLCRVGILGRAVRCSLLDQIARCVIGVRGRPVLAGLAGQTVLQVVGVSIRAVRKQIARKVVGILCILALDIGTDKLICLIVVVAHQLVLLANVHTGTVLTYDIARVIVGVRSLTACAVALGDFLLQRQQTGGVIIILGRAAVAVAFLDRASFRVAGVGNACAVVVGLGLHIAENIIRGRNGLAIGIGDGQTVACRVVGIRRGRAVLIRNLGSA